MTFLRIHLVLIWSIRHLIDSDSIEKHKRRPELSIFVLGFSIRKVEPWVFMSETLLWKKKCIRNTVFADQRIWDRSVKIMAADWLAGAWSILSTRNFVFSLVFTILRTPCAFLFSECWHFFVRCKVARAWNKSHIFKCQGWKLIEAYFKTHHTWWVWCLDAKAAVLL